MFDLFIHTSLSFLFLETLFKMGFIEQLVGLLRSPQNSSHEHIVSLLVTFVTDYPQGISECHRPEFDLEKILKSIITSSMEDDPDLHEVNNIELNYLRYTVNFCTVNQREKCWFWQIFVEAPEEFPNHFIQAKTSTSIHKYLR